MQDSLLTYFGESVISFDQFIIHTPSGQVFKGKELVKLEPQVFTFLLLLIRNKDHIVSRDQIISEVWAGKKASDDAIRALVKKLRIALGDNARAPKFVKTVPLQGYLFIMPVQIEYHQGDWWRSKYVIYSASIVAIILITLLVQSQFGSFQSNEKLKEKRKVFVSTISEMKGSEVSFYLSKNDRLLYSHRGKNDQSLQLYAKDLNSSVSKRLTWDNANYVDGIFSSDARQAIVKRREGDEESLLLFKFDEQFNLVGVEPIVLDEDLLSQNIQAVSYSHDGKSLYLTSEYAISESTESIVEESFNTESLDNSSGDNIGGATSPVTANASVALLRYSIETKESVALPVSIPLGSQIVDAKESHNGELLAVLVGSEKQFDMHIWDLVTKEEKFVKRMPRFSNSFVWSADASSITLSNKAGKLFKLNLSRQRLYAWSGLETKVSEVVSQCGEFCFVVKEQVADLVNIVERPFSFKNQAYISANQFSLTSNDRFPNYFDDGKGIYFLSLTDSSLSLMRYKAATGIESIYDLPRTSDINSFILSPDEKQFAGELDGRIFVYNLGMKTLSFVTSGAQRHSNPVWVTNDTLYYQKEDAGTTVIYEHDLLSNKVNAIANELLLIKPLGENQWLLIDKSYQAYLYKSQIEQGQEQGQEASPDKQLSAFKFSTEQLAASKNFAVVESANSSNFSVVNNELFYLSKLNTLPSLSKLDLKTGELDSRELGLSSVLAQLDIRPDLQTILVVESSLSQSNLLKVDGLTLTTRQVNQVLSETP
ncbi:MAG: transcriptional activator of cad operon [Glaciecola sp.]